MTIINRLLFIFALASLTSVTASAYYGSGVGSDGLANLQLGAAYGYQVSYRFQAQNSASLASIRPYIIYTTEKPGYNAGTGGTVVVKLEADNGSGEPSGVALAIGTLTSPLTKGHFPSISLSPQVQLSAGKIYHLVFSNSDSNPSVNYVSVDCLYSAAPTSPMQPTVSDMNSAVLQSTGGSSSFNLVKDFTPIIEVDYSNGESEGKWGYIDSYVDFPQPISGSEMARETITVSGSNQTVSSASVRLSHISGTGNLTVNLESGSGSLIDQGTIAYSAFSGSRPTWVTANFGSSHSLTAGQTYNLVLSAPSSSVYEIYPIEKGGSYGYKTTTYFGDGFAQYTSGSSGWLGWTFSSTGSATAISSDLQFYFNYTNSGSGSGSGNYVNTVLADSPILYWRLDETSAQINDSSSHGNDGTAFNVGYGAKSLLQSSSDPSSSFNGTSSYASSGIGEINTYLSAGNGVAGISAEILFNASSAISGTETLLLLGSQSSSKGYHWMYLRNDGTLCWQYADGSSFQTQCTSFTPSPGAVYDITVTHDYAGKHLIFFINGHSYDTINLSDSVLPLVDVPVMLGSYGGSKDFFGGELGEASIYNHVLTPTEVLNHWSTH